MKKAKYDFLYLGLGLLGALSTPHRLYAETSPVSIEKLYTSSLSIPSGSGILVTYSTQKTRANMLRLKLETDSQAFSGKPASLITQLEHSELTREFASFNYTEISEQIFFLSPVESYQAPTFASEANKDLLQSDVIAKLSRDQAENLLTYSMRNGFYNTSLDSVASTRPPARTVEEDIRFQKQMASTLKRYILLKGLPKFILSREDTKEVGKTLDKTIHAVQNTTTVSFKSKENTWAFNAGVNPINFNSWARYQNENWVFSATTNLKDVDPRLEATHLFGLANEYTLSSAYFPSRQVLDPSVGWQVDRDLRTAVGTTIPLAAPDISESVVTTVSFFYTF
jgi:hypothetical protein